MFSRLTLNRIDGQSSQIHARNRGFNMRHPDLVRIVKDKDGGLANLWFFVLKSVILQNYRTSPDDVKRAFSKYGEVKDVYLPLDYYTRKPRGFGFVEFVERKEIFR